MTDREQIRADIKRRLNSYREIDAERRQLLDELERLEALMTSPSSPNMDGMPRTPGVSNPVERMAVAHITMQTRYKAKIDEMMVERAAIEDMLEALEPTERRLARYRYIDGLSWEAVCEMMCYSWRQTHRIHARMLERLVDAEVGKQ